ncbi:MAG TPA: glycerophosphodiester phosphodiesterase family protein [Longimicrobiaceae bacterium]|nr:glycerophosphodiester phosphodiesterase family protein [Longimicrobiaceae bacterium]
MRAPRVVRPTAATARPVSSEPGIAPSATAVAGSDPRRARRSHPPITDMDRSPAHPFPHALILGHRGASAEAPENTMRAFRLALEHGADGVELDVQRSADGVPVVIHDPTLERTTDGTGAVSDLPWPAISRVRSRGEPVPRLDEVAAWAAAEGAWLNVEIKAPGVEAATVAVIRAAGMMERTVFSSFDGGSVAEVGVVAPDATRYLLTETWDDSVIATARRIGAGGICLHGPLATHDALQRLRKESLPVVIWTVDDPDRIAELLRAGVAAVITNRPAVGVEARSRVR